MAENWIAVTETPWGTENTTQPRSHWPGDNEDRFDPSSDSADSGPENCEPDAEVDTPADEPFDSSAEKSCSSTPVCEPFGPAHAVASIASQVWPADGVFASWLESVTPGYQAETCTLVMPPNVCGICTFVPIEYWLGFAGVLAEDAFVPAVTDEAPAPAPDVVRELAGETADPDVTELVAVHAPTDRPPPRPRRR